MNFSIRLTEIQASFIDNEMHEIFLIAAKNIILNMHEKIMFSIEGLVVNDMYWVTLSPVVLNVRDHPFFLVEISSKYPLKMLIFEDITIMKEIVGDLIAQL